MYKMCTIAEKSFVHLLVGCPDRFVQVEFYGVMPQDKSSKDLILKAKLFGWNSRSKKIFTKS